MPGENTSGWGEYRRLVLSELRRTIQGVQKVEASVEEVKSEMRILNKNLEHEMKLYNENAEKRIGLIETTIAINNAKAKVKASIYGGLAGLILGIIPQIASYFLSK